MLGGKGLVLFSLLMRGGLFMSGVQCCTHADPGTHGLQCSVRRVCVHPSISSGVRVYVHVCAPVPCPGEHGISYTLTCDPVLLLCLVHYVRSGTLSSD